MKALLLAGGKGTRLRPLTNKIPKPMVPVMGRPLLESTILNLRENGIKEILISTCYKSKYIKDYFKDGSNLGVKISYISEDIPLGTGGAIKKAEKFIDDTCIIFNSDILSDINIKDLISYHRSKSADVTIAATYVDNPSQYGVLEYDKNYFIKSFKEKPKQDEITSHLINAGIYVFEPRVLKEIPDNKVVSIEKDTYPMLLSKGYKVCAYESHSYWMDIGNLEKYIRCHKDIMDGKCKLIGSHIKNLYLENNVILPYSDTKISSKSKIIGPSYIGHNVFIGDRTIIGPYAFIGDNSNILAQSKIKESVLWDNVRINRRASLFRTVVASNCIVDNDRKFSNTACVEKNNIAI